MFSWYPYQISFVEMKERLLGQFSEAFIILRELFLTQRPGCQVGDASSVASKISVVFPSKLWKWQRKVAAVGDLMETRFYLPWVRCQMASQQGPLANENFPSERPCPLHTSMALPKGTCVIHHT